MGIINITPDSFSKDGLYHKTNYIDLALEQAEQMVIDGADFLDVGAESTRPGAIAVSEGEEIARLLPLIKELVRNVRLPISVDTYKPIVAEEALNAGASIINDIWGLQAPGDLEHQMAMIIAEAKVPVIIMHNKTNPGYGFLMKEIIDSLSRSIEIACQSGIDLEKIIVDPGIGFAKSYQDNLYILQNLDQLKILGRPILLGASRKSVVGLTLDLPVNERLEGTIATSIWGIAKGANILRVHDILAHSRAVKMCDAIKNR
jgi:dihydropteroate synthase